MNLFRFIISLISAIAGVLSMGAIKPENTVDPYTEPVAGLYTESIMSLHDVFEPQYVPELFRRYDGQYMPMFQMFRGMGRELPVSRDEWYGFEENWWHRDITVKSDVADPGAGNTSTITLAADDHDSEGNTYAREGDIVTIPSTWVQAIVQTKTTTVPTAHTLVLKPLRAADNIGALTAGQKLSITNGAFAAGTDQPKGTVVGATKRTFYAQIFKESIGVEGSQLVNSTWFKVVGENGSVKGYWSPGYMRGEYLLSLKMDGAYTWGVESDNVTATADNGSVNKVKTTRGVFPWVDALGKKINVTPGAFDILDLDEVGLYLKSQGITSGIVLVMTGAKLTNDLDNAVKDYIDGNGTDLTRVEKTLFKGNRELSLSLNVKVITKGGITFVIKPMDVWSNPKTFGNTGYNLDQYGLWCPITQVKDPMNGALMPNIASRYRAMGGYSRRFETWRLAGAGGGLYVKSIDEENTEFRAHHGLQMFKVNQMGMFKPGV